VDTKFSTTRLGLQRFAYDLLYFPLVQIDARSEIHG